jgi:hypothetical protein
MNDLNSDQRTLAVDLVDRVETLLSGKRRRVLTVAVTAAMTGSIMNDQGEIARV